MSIFDRFRRAPKVKESLSWPAIISAYGAGSYVWTPRNYAALSKAGYQSVPAIFACVSRIATLCASIDWYIMSGENEVLKHPLLDLLMRPNEFDSRTAFIQKVISYLLLAGNSYIERVQGIPTAPPKYLYVLRPDRMMARAGTGPREYISAWEYNANGRVVLYKPEQILHLMEFHPTHDFYGLSRLEVAAKDIDIANLSKQWNANILNREMRIPGALTVEGPLTEEQRKGLRAELAQYQGADNAGRIPIFEGGTGGMKWQPMAETAKDMDWQESEKRNLRSICAVFNYPSQLMGDTEATTYANMQEARAALYMEGILPLMDLLRDELNYWLTPLYGKGVSLEYDKDSITALQEDQATKYGYLSQAEFLSTNEKRDATGWDDVGPEGDDIMVSLSKIPLTEAIAAPQPVPAALQKPGKEPTTFPEPIPPAPEPKKSASVEHKSFWNEPERKRRLWTSFDRRVTSHEKALIPLVEKYLKQQADRVRDRVQGGAANHQVFLVGEESKAYVERFFPHYERAFRQAGQAGLHATRGKLYDPAEESKDERDAFNPTDEQWKKLRQQIEKSSTFFNDTTWQTVKDSIEVGLRETMTTEELAQFLWKTLDDRAAWEARRIAATEMTRTDNWGLIEGYKQNGDVTMKGWHCSMLPTSRDDHIEADGQEVGVDEDFEVGGFPMFAPGDERGGAGEVCNCRCSTYAVIGD